MSNSKLLVNWVVSTLAENPDILESKMSATALYSKLFDFWAKDMQGAMGEVYRLMKEEDKKSNK